MRRSVALVILISSTCISLGRAAAEPVAPPSCETVTTVRCTGSAAALALPGNAQKAAALVPAPTVAPPAALPPQADDREVPAPYQRPPQEPSPYRPCCANSPAGYGLSILPGGWSLVRNGGELMLERKKRTGVAAVWAPGLLLWIASYMGTGIGGVRNERPWAAAPFLGGFIAGGIDLADGKWGGGVGYSIGSVMQLSGFVMFLVGLSVGEKVERMPVVISPMGYRDGGGLSLGGRF